ncbi:MAG: hypothetical protein ACWGON_03120 [Gemmatimonadota bacterium]
MLRFRQSSWIRSFLLPFATALWLGTASCTSWKTVKPPVVSTLKSKQPDKVRVTMPDGSEFEVVGPRIVADSLIGVAPVTRDSNENPRIAVALGDVRGVEVNETDAVKTVGLLIGLGTLVALGVAIASYDDSWSWGGNSGSSSSGSDTQFSCPLVYSWDGDDWRLDSGTFGGAILEPLARTDIDGLAHARAFDGELRLRLANELQETDFVDAFDLLSVNHSPGTEVIPDGTGTRHGAGALHVVGELSAPLVARDDHGRDALAAVLGVDGWGWESSPTGRDTAVAADVRSALELEFSRPPGATGATLVIHGNNTPWAAWLMGDFVAKHGRETDAWYAAMNADPEASQKLGRALAGEAFLSVSVWTGAGWEPRGLVWEAGPEVAKRQALRLDLAGVVGETVRVRLESVPLFWNLDQVAIDYSEQPEPAVEVVEPERMVMEHDGRDVRGLLAEVDGAELVLETGDAVELTFQVPPVPDGMARSYLIATTGWYRIHAPESDAPPRADLARIGSEPGAVSKMSVARMNEALTAWNARSGFTAGTEGDR